MAGSAKRVKQALAHKRPDRTPLFEIFQAYHPIHWEICGRNLATDETMAWDAMADGVAWEELLQAHIQAHFAVCQYFGLDMVRMSGAPPPNYVRPVKLGNQRWHKGGLDYCVNPRTRLVELENPGIVQSDSHKYSEDTVRRELLAWEPTVPAYTPAPPDPFVKGFQDLAAAEGLDWVYMGEIGAGTGVAFFPHFLYMWMIEEPELVHRWILRQKLGALLGTRRQIESGCSVVAMGGDIACDKGPFISPAHYREFILPVIREHDDQIHSLGAKAVYTSDGNVWPVRDMFFFESGIDGYKEVDKAAGMTWPRLLAEGVADRVCIIGNIDARHTLCLGTPEQVRAEVIECLRYGQQARGGHILHASHSCHEDVRPANYRAVVEAYREFFGLPKLPD